MRSDWSLSRPVIGVLGGMGPGATADFLHRLARLTPAQRDQDHLSTIVYSDPKTPDRSDAILQEGASPLPALLHGISFLNGAGCTTIAIPCNTAHNWHSEMANASQVPVMHIAEAVARELQTQPHTPQTVGLLSTLGTSRAQIYQRWLHPLGLRVLDLDESATGNAVMRGIRTYKAGNVAEARDLLGQTGKELIRQGADALLVACTDISAALSDMTVISDTPVFDAAECLARACINDASER